MLPESVDLQVTHNCLTGRPVPLLYDSILTMPDEVDLIWRRKLSAASIIFIVNRVALVVSVILAILGTINTVRQVSNVELLLPFIPALVVSRLQTSYTWRKQQTPRRCGKLLGAFVVRELLPLIVSACTSADNFANMTMPLKYPQCSLLCACTLCAIDPSCSLR